ncbi:glycosyltransferase [Mycolicibacterium holsaticum]|uniref:glycosyltransferase n=1 Tax=Mycolicibacterium holsaticum TaxID=152142 RepID=UPI001C7D4F7E|nr:glycosyltransferase [Mycolicibacterium holsaticum]QZA12181.1 glycosyltransferase [Mycolicibacterium holsaticum DSM 44478 = JCM 12374]UNC10333.1 glycosyltransferase [Mycolicibacterium holsaticum DSM 44478 = JCM 12374]
MRFVLSSYGGRGDIEPAVVVGRELQRGGHDVCMAVPPNLIDFAAAAGLEAIGYGLDSAPILNLQRTYFTCYSRTPWKLKELRRMARETEQFAAECWAEMTRSLMVAAEGADLLLTGLIFEQPAANVAEALDIPLATLHYFPCRAHGQLMPFLPPPLSRTVMTVNDWLAWRGTRSDEDTQRRELGLASATGPAPRRITERDALEIQAYDRVCFPRLADEWAKWNGKRPFVGALALESPTDADEEVAEWIAAGTPPIFFGFGSVPIGSPAEMIQMIGAACAQLGERAIVGAGGTDFGVAPTFDHVKVVGQVNYASIFPMCRAVVHHGGSGTLAACLRAGVPQLILWTLPDQPFFAAQLKRMKVGAGQRFSTTNEKSLRAGLRRILTPQYRRRAREMAPHIINASESASAAASLVEDFARLRARR